MCYLLEILTQVAHLVGMVFHGHLAIGLLEGAIIGVAEEGVEVVVYEQGSAFASSQRVEA